MEFGKHFLKPADQVIKGLLDERFLSMTIVDAAQKCPHVRYFSMRQTLSQLIHCVSIHADGKACHGSITLATAIAGHHPRKRTR